MSELKCPFCQQELVREGSDNYWCKKCNLERRGPALYGSQELWQELIRTRKALAVAIDALKSAHGYYQNCVIREKQPQEINWYCAAMNMDNDIFKALNEITALEQKDVK